MTIPEESMISEELKANLADNAFDFLEKAIEQFDKEPKYSITNFAIAVELFLKLRLMHEDWELICTSKSPNLSALKDGSARTINFSDIVPKIEENTCYRFSIDMKKCFEEIAKHRNRIVHFYHGDLFDEKGKIFIQELKGWQHLQTLINDWGFIFYDDTSPPDDALPYREKISRIDELMNKNKKFLEEKYNLIKSEIQEDKKNGITYIECSICEYDALQKIKEPDVPAKDYLGRNVCRVCDFSESFIQIPCPDGSCNEIIRLNEGEGLISVDKTICPECDEDITIKYVKENLETRSRGEIDEAYKDGDDVGYANCSFCDHHECVIEHHDSYICANCITVTGNIYQCDNCGVGQNSYIVSPFGCDNCTANFLAKIEAE